VKKYGLVIPIHNAKPHLEEVLRDLDMGCEWDVVLVDDGSSDGSLQAAQELLPRARTIRNNQALGPAQARNLGLSATRADIVVFLDSDVVASKAVVEELAGLLVERPELSAAFGAYDDRPAVRTHVSQFRNLLHHYVHCRSGGVVPSFWSGFGAVRRSSFEAVGGFDSRRFPLPSVEDIDLGARLWNAGYQAYLEPTLQVTHLKNWTITNVVRTDIQQRARPWVKMVLEGRAPRNTLNLNHRFKLPVILLGLLILASTFSFFAGDHEWVPVLLGVSYLLRNLDVYQFMGRRGLGLASVTLLALHHCCALVGACLAVLDHLFSKPRITS
jgi:glycosyltransferase involved in cell wall biosynthesis